MPLAVKNVEARRPFLCDEIHTAIESALDDDTIIGKRKASFNGLAIHGVGVIIDNRPHKVAVFVLSEENKLFIGSFKDCFCSGTLVNLHFGLPP